jgi:hypothetical protein
MLRLTCRAGGFMKKKANHGQVQAVVMQCGYCFHEKPANDFKKVFLRDGLRSWQGPMFICSQCKNYLRGLFKYA